jgi:hypothetical protein
MSNYFSYFPIIQYNGTNCVDITKRFQLIQSLLTDATIYYQYSIDDGDRPDTIADKIYNDANLDWLVCMSNNIKNIDIDWYMGYSQFISYLTAVYGSYEASTQRVHHYEWILQHRSISDDGTITPERVINIDEAAYNTTVDDNRRLVTCFDYESEKNDSHRIIKLIKPTYIRQIIKEVSKIFNNG